MPLPDHRAMRWWGGAFAATLLGAAVVLLASAPVPATSGPGAAAVTGPESAPHTHVMSAAPGAPVPVGGLSPTAGGYAFVATGQSPFTFHIQGPDGRPVTRFAIVHDKLMHLVVVRRDLSGYQHLHPSLAADGTWTIALGLPAPGPYRAYFDFTAIDTAGRQNAVVLGADLPANAPAASAAPVGDSLSVTREGTLTVGVAEPVFFRVTRDGAPVTLQPYLGASGHLTVLRVTDLAYLHIHPEPGLVDGAMLFWVAAPSTGMFRLFLDYQVDGRVHTAVLTMQVGKPRSGGAG